ncbi:MAG: hypothetical protein RJA22_1848 [Verrucomicrobiota bacterium]|jgi:mono/diheme cytochrome c family protein
MPARPPALTPPGLALALALPLFAGPGGDSLRAAEPPPGAAASAPAVDLSRLPAAGTAPVDYLRDIQPLLEQACLRCHGPEKPKGRYRMDTREGLLRGGDVGVAILPGRSADSPLIHYVARLVEDMEMPPVGKGEPLTPAQVGLLRAWIDQGAAWAAPAAPPAVTAEAEPVVGGVAVRGDAARFREQRWQPEGWNGGLAHFAVREQRGLDGEAVLEGRALRDDYRVTLSLEEREGGFLRFGWEQARKYFDDSGGYYAGFDPGLYRLDQDLGLDQGRLWADLGLRLPDWPDITVGYEYQSRSGDKSTLQWGAVTGAGDVTRNIYPNAKSIEESTHVLKLEVEHEVGGYRLLDSFRGEFYDLSTSRRNTVAVVPAAGGVTQQDVIQERTTYASYANAFRVEKQVTRHWLASAGYHYHRLEPESSVSLDQLNGAGQPFGYRWRMPEVVLDRSTHTVNASSLLGTWQGFTLSAGLLGEWMEQTALGSGDYGTEAFGFASPMPGTIRSSHRRATAEQTAQLRYTTLPFTTLFAQAGLKQESYGENEQNTAPDFQFQRDTDAWTTRQDWRCGFNTAPGRRVTLNGHYRRQALATDFDHDLDTTPGYPAFIDWRSVTTDEVETRLAARWTAWLRTSLSYKHVDSDYETETDTVPGVSAGGRLHAAQHEAHIVSLNTTLTPWRRAHLSTTLSYQDTETSSYDQGSAAVVPYRGDLFSAVVSGTYLLGRRTDLLAAYAFSWADYAQDNAAAGLPLGIHYRQHALTFGVARRLSSQVSTRLQYGFYRYDEPSSGGYNDYTAHALFGTLSIRVP